MESYKKHIWLNFDLGIRGDYAGLYAWLDNQKAVECGRGTALLKIDSTQIKGDIITFLKNEISAHVKIKEGNQIYAVWREGDNIKGRFIFGNRQRAPWEGYAFDGNGEIEDFEEKPVL